MLKISVEAKRESHFAAHRTCFRKWLSRFYVLYIIHRFLSDVNCLVVFDLYDGSRSVGFKCGFHYLHNPHKLSVRYYLALKTVNGFYNIAIKIVNV